LPLGEAFQLRDDVLGVLGDPEVTGKPAGDDLREGKRTVLIAIAAERATPAQASLIRGHLGDPDLSGEGVDLLREVLTDTGSFDHVEALIKSRTEQAVAALSAIDEPARSVLADLALAATTRRV
jgi:geranylgeranyl diphosphate synthase type I